jgi:hypothetical protein
MAGWIGARRALVAYVAAWLIGAALVTTALVVLLDRGEEEPVALPPVRQTELDLAAQVAGCELRRKRDGEALNPPVTGPGRAAPAQPGFYETQPATGSLIAALRRGIVVIHFRADLDDSRLDELRPLQEAVPTGTIVTPNATGMTYEIAVTAYGRLLGCPRFTDATLDAIQLFRGRRLGGGPDG